MSKFSIELELTHDFEIDCMSFCEWAKDNLGLEKDVNVSGWLIFCKDGELTEDVTGEYSSDELKQLKEHYDSLTEGGEAAKLSLPSRLKGQDLADWKDSKKAEIAAITDFSSLSEAQKKLWMGLELTNEEKDGLGV